MKAGNKVHSFGKREQAIRRNPNVPVIVRGWLHKQVSMQSSVSVHMLSDNCKNLSPRAGYAGQCWEHPWAFVTRDLCSTHVKTRFCVHIWYRSGKKWWMDAAILVKCLSCSFVVSVWWFPLFYPASLLPCWSQSPWDLIINLGLGVKAICFLCP